MTLTEIDADLIELPRLAGCVIDALTIERRQSRRTDQRGITAREALHALRFEAQLVAVAAQNIASGLVLDADDLARVMVAWGRIETILQEVG